MNAFDIVKLTARGAKSIDYLCTKLGCSEKELRAKIASSNKAGWAIGLTQGHVFSNVAVGPTDAVTLGIPTPGRHHIAFVTDLHSGSSHFDDKALLSFLRLAAKKGCTYGVMAGDLTDGVKPLLVPDQRYTGWDAQADHLVDVLRKGPAIEWATITGNHDGYTSHAGGFDAGRSLELKMRAAGVAWHHTGTCVGRAVICGARVHLWHPAGGASTRNSVRRVLNERIEALQEPADVLVMGHLHKYATVSAYPENVYGVAGGTFQLKKSEFANRITRPWDIGGTVISFTVRRDRTVGEFSSEFFPAVPS